MQHALPHCASAHWVPFVAWLAQTPPRPPHCCKAATDSVQFAGVLTRLLSPSGLLAAVTAPGLAGAIAAAVLTGVTAVVGLLTTALTVAVEAGTTMGTGVTSALAGTGGAGALVFTV